MENAKPTRGQLLFLFTRIKIPSEAAHSVLSMGEEINSINFLYEQAIVLQHCLRAWVWAIKWLWEGKQSPEEANA